MGPTTWTDKNKAEPTPGWGGALSPGRGIIKSQWPFCYNTKAQSAFVRRRFTFLGSSPARFRRVIVRKHQVDPSLSHNTVRDPFNVEESSIGSGLQSGSPVNLLGVPHFKPANKKKLEPTAVIALRNAANKHTHPF